MNISVEVGVFAASIGILIGLFKLYEFFEQRAPASIRSDVSTFNTRLGLILLSVQDHSPHPAFHKKVAHVLDRVFGAKLLSPRSVWMTALHSYLIIATTAVVGYACNLVGAGVSGGATRQSLATSLVALPIMPVTIVIATIVPDVCAMLAARYAMRKFEARSRALQVILIVFIFVGVVALAFTSAAFMSLKNSLYSWLYRISPLPDIPVERNVNVAQMSFAFLSTFAVLLWVAAYLVAMQISQLIVVTWKLIALPGSVSWVRDHPLYITTVVVVLLLLAMSFAASIVIQ